jgi:hypothetical protein
MSTMSPHPAETSRPVSRLLNCLRADACARRRANHKSGLPESLKVGLVALTVALIEAQSLRSHALYLLIKCTNFLIEPRVLRFWRIAAAQRFERFLNGEFGGFSHGNYPKTWRATSRLGENLQPDIVPWDNSAVRVSRIQSDCECVRPHSTHRALMRVDGPGYPQVRGRYVRLQPLRLSPALPF